MRGSESSAAVQEGGLSDLEIIDRSGSGYEFRKREINEVGFEEGD